MCWGDFKQVICMRKNSVLVWDTVKNVNCNFRMVTFSISNVEPSKAHFGRARKVICSQPDGCNWTGEVTALLAGSQKYQEWLKFLTLTPEILPKTYRYDRTNFMGVFWRLKRPYLWKKIHSNKTFVFVLVHSVIDCRITT